MPERATSLVSGLFAGTFTSAALLGLDMTASSAAECLENPDLWTATLSHWYYHSGWTRYRRCWFFVPVEVTADTPVYAPPIAACGPPVAVSTPPAATVDDYSLQSLLSYFTSGFSQPSSPPPQQMEVLHPQPNGIPDQSGEATRTISPKPARPNRTARRERPQTAPPPKTTGSAVPSDQPEQSASHEKRDLLNKAAGEALFWGVRQVAVGQEPVRPQVMGANAARRLRVQENRCSS